MLFIYLVKNITNKPKILKLWGIIDHFTYFIEHCNPEWTLASSNHLFPVFFIASEEDQPQHPEVALHITYFFLHIHYSGLHSTASVEFCEL